MEAPAAGGVKAGVHGLAGVAAGGQILPPQPHHHPLIGFRGVDDGPVNQVVLNQQNVPGLEEVGDALHHIGDLAAQQQNQLVKLVIVVIQLWRAGVLQVEEAEALVEIAPLSNLAPIQHGLTSGIF